MVAKNALYGARRGSRARERLWACRLANCVTINRLAGAETVLRKSVLLMSSRKARRTRSRCMIHRGSARPLLETHPRGRLRDRDSARGTYPRNADPRSSHCRRTGSLAIRQDGTQEGDIPGGRLYRAAAVLCLKRQPRDRPINRLERDKLSHARSGPAMRCLGPRIFGASHRAVGSPSRRPIRAPPGRHIAFCYPDRYPRGR